MSLSPQRVSHGTFKLSRKPILEMTWAPEMYGPLDDIGSVVGWVGFCYLHPALPMKANSCDLCAAPLSGKARAHTDETRSWLGPSHGNRAFGFRLAGRPHSVPRSECGLSVKARRRRANLALLLASLGCLSLQPAHWTQFRQI